MSSFCPASTPTRCTVHKLNSTQLNSTPTQLRGASEAVNRASSPSLGAATKHYRLGKRINLPSPVSAGHISHSKTSHINTSHIRTSHINTSHIRTLHISTSVIRTSHVVQAQQQDEAPDSVTAALQKAEAALKAAEVGLDQVEHLPSARKPSPVSGVLSDMKKLVMLVGVIAAIAACHAAGIAAKLTAGVFSSFLIAGWGLRKGSLSPSGAAAAMVVGTGTLGFSFRMGCTLLAFFFSSSLLTRLMEHQKAVDEEFKEGGQRDWRQVFCNGLLPTCFAVAYGSLTRLCDLPLSAATGGQDVLLTALPAAFLGYYSCCCGDTWASEVGQLSSDTPRLITTGRPVRKGVNGGVTILGLLASAAGGLMCGLVFHVAGLLSPSAPIGSLMFTAKQWKVIIYGLAAGLFGSVVDSLLGATIQFSGFNRQTGRVTSKLGPEVVHISGLPILDNNLVNLASATITAAVAAYTAAHGPALFRIVS